MTAVAVPNVYLGGRSDIGIFSISMFDGDLIGGLRLNKRMKPFLGDRGMPNFWLEGRMTIKLRPAGSNEVVSLVSRKPVLQTGRATSWPPFGTVMRDVSGPNEYVPIDAQDGPPFLILWSGSIRIGDEPSDFLSQDLTIYAFDYVKTDEPTRLGGVKLTWNDARTEVPAIDYYHLYRRELGTGLVEMPWERVGGDIKDNYFVDASFDGSKAMTYLVRQVSVDHLGDEIIGPGGPDLFTVPALPHNFEQLRASGFR
ncbi:MAG TPA: hypothetical protein VD861_12350 [Pyrinomonadaceae bacterium]|nr:hypothetical protein [Pyrinomonadaceae bacterium]